MFGLLIFMLLILGLIVGVLLFLIGDILGFVVWVCGLLGLLLLRFVCAGLAVVLCFCCCEFGLECLGCGWYGVWCALHGLRLIVLLWLSFCAKFVVAGFADYDLFCCF